MAQPILAQLVGKEKRYSSVTLYEIVRDLLPADWKLEFSGFYARLMIVECMAYADSIHNQLSDIARTLQLNLKWDDDMKIVALTEQSPKLLTGHQGDGYMHIQPPKVLGRKLRYRLYTLVHIVLEEPKPGECLVDSETMQPVYDAIHEHHLGTYFIRTDWTVPDGRWLTELKLIELSPRHSRYDDWQWDGDVSKLPD